MSLSRPRVTENPAKATINYSGDTGEWSYYDKATKENFLIQRPATLIVLDDLFAVGGFSKTYDDSFFYSNEVHSIDQALRVRTRKGGFDESGTYRELKERLNSIGAKYIKHVYALAQDGFGVYDNEIVRLVFGGAALGPWIDKKIVAGYQVTIEDETVEGKNGKVIYQMPVLSAEVAKDLSGAIEADEILQAYFDEFRPRPVSPLIAQAEAHTEKFKQDLSIGPDSVLYISKQPEEKELPQEESDDNDLPF